MCWHLPLKQLRYFIVLIIATSLCLTAPAYAKPPVLNVGDLAPNWMLQDTQDQPILLYDIADKTDATVMFFWATWCQKCSELLPQLQEIADNSANKNMAFYTLNIWEDKDPVAHLAALNVTIPLLPKAESVALRFGVAGTPSLIIVGNDRKILANLQAGEVANLAQLFEQLIKQPLQ